MKTITILQAASFKAQEIREIESNREYVGNNATDQRIEFLRNMSDSDYVNTYNEVALRESAKELAAREKRAAISSERKSTGKSKREYREEYDRLNKLYKAGDFSAKEEMKRIQKFAFC